MYLRACKHLYILTGLLWEKYIFIHGVTTAYFGTWVLLPPPSQALSSQCVFLFLSLPLPFLWLSPAASVSCSPCSHWLTALFHSGSNSCGSDLGLWPLIWPAIRWLCCVFGWKTARIIFVKDFWSVDARAEPNRNDEKLLRDMEPAHQAHAAVHAALWFDVPNKGSEQLLHA